MIKKTLAIIALLLFTLSLKAQNYDGVWHRYPVFNDAVDNVVETSEKVYYRSSNSLFSFSPVDNESYSYNATNRLSEEGITEIYYNVDKKYLLLAYESGNIDLLYDDGRIINLPEIKDVVITDTKGIRDVKFFDGGFVVATDFGFVIYDDNKLVVKESGMFGSPVDHAAVNGNNLYLMIGKEIYVSPLSDAHYSLDRFQLLGTFQINNFFPLGDDHFLLSENVSNRIYSYQFEPQAYDGHRTDLLHYNEDLRAILAPKRYAGGWFFATPDKLVTVPTEGTYSAKTLPEGIAGQFIAINRNTDKVWGADGEGVAQYDISGDTPTVLFGKQLVPGAITCENVAFMRWSPDGKRLYINNITYSQFKTNRAASESAPVYQTGNVIENGEPRDVSLKNAVQYSSTSKKNQQNNNSTRLYGGSAWLQEDPDDPSIYYTPVNFDGVFVVKDGQQLNRIDVQNRAFDVNIDPEGNLWCGFISAPCYAVLPAAKRRDIQNVTKNDFIPVTSLNEGIQKDASSIFLKDANGNQTDIVCISRGKWGGGLDFLDTKGTYTDPSDDVKVNNASWVDQDGNSFSSGDYYYIGQMTQDKQGWLWVTYYSGVFVIKEPWKQMENNDMFRPKVPRNDGTDYADYLLQGTRVNWVAVDPANRKWLATEGSGVYLVSPEGDQILQHFDTDNSPLCSNFVYTVECDPNDNTVYFGTKQGLYSYKSDAAPAKEDFSEILAYPNPVRPDYTGWVTISGLKDNSLVKITDSAGNTVANLRSQGGMTHWDVCNASGQRVRSGVYYVMASENEGGSSTGAVTKIVVIN